MNNGPIIAQMPKGSVSANPSAVISAETSAYAGKTSESTFSGYLHDAKAKPGAAPTPNNEVSAENMSYPTDPVIAEFIGLQLAALSATTTEETAVNTEGDSPTVLTSQDDDMFLTPDGQHQNQTPQNVVFSTVSYAIASQQSLDRILDAVAADPREMESIMPSRSIKGAESQPAHQGAALAATTVSSEVSQVFQQTTVAQSNQLPTDQGLTQPLFPGISQDDLLLPVVETAQPAPTPRTTVPTQQSDTAITVKPAEMVSGKSMVQPVLDAYLQPSSGAILNSTTVDQDEAATIQTNRIENLDIRAPGVGNATELTVNQSISPETGTSSGNEGGGTFSQHLETHPQMAHLKPQHATTTVDSPTTPDKTATQTDILNQVAAQMKEHFNGKDLKSGAEQIVIRLSPESLGELTLNLHMENQRLKVEIIAENNIVRDNLLKHSDTLKESLASQSITMDKFDVSTNSGRNGMPFHGQGQAGWQELMRQKQQGVLHASGGYRLNTTPNIPEGQVYLASGEHSMLDVHF